LAFSYPEAFEALHSRYASAYNYQFLMVRRFIKCNFSLSDKVDDVQPDGSFRFEYVPCPLRGECIDECIVCCPKLNTTLSKREMEVLKLYAENFLEVQIGNMLFISVNTVHNHIRHIHQKLGTHSKSELVTWSNNNISKA